MRDKQVQKIMRSLADEKAPGASIDLWSSIRTQALAAESKPRHARRSRLRLVGAALGLAVLLVGVVFILSPQGQAWAQEAFQFFTQTESDRIPHESYQATLAARSPSSAPEDASVTEADPTSTPSDPLDGLMTLEEVQEEAGFVPYQALWLPEDFEFVGAAYNEETQVVSLRYDRLGDMANSFTLSQEPFYYLTDCDLCTSVGTSADIQKVSIHDVYGEYVEGVWTGQDGDSVWENDPYMKRMIWRTDGMAFQIHYGGFPAYMLKKDMIEIAESLGTSQNLSIMDHLTLEEVQEISGLQIYQPTWQQDDLKFKEAIYNTETGVVTLMYAYQGNFNNMVGLKMESLSDLGTCYLCRVVGSSAIVRRVSINGFEGEYVEGVWTWEDGEVVWKSFSHYLALKHLIWQTDEMIFEVNYMGYHLNKMDLIEIAESVR
jgi:hypothetical protein